MALSLRQEGMPPSDCDDMLTPDTDKLDSPPPPLSLNIRGGGTGAKSSNQLSGIRTLRAGRKDYKKSGDTLRGKNVMDGYRLKDKDLKRTMK
jgi:hypothetical protein